MVFFTAPALLMLMTLSLLSAEEDYLEVIYPQNTITLSSGSSTKLSCEANYDLVRCGVVHVVWHKIEQSPKKSLELTHPDLYFTTVNETTMVDNMRRRQVVTDIIRVTPEDSGLYQCKATCHTGAQAMGHFITINVKRRGFP